ncbi:protoheme IX farnesyltransferase [Oceanobacillus limi]|uniref:Protoheme IX farnesyltransferase n=1 Tax=Oceanobacillus limi TaxID=930131 RepID=A0A1I0FNJ2_9BACI|nr:heme o synthase [Oceanobacillus limi]SET58866.1 protoheme IX farnesyltransferase [Oceanobacillus limi]
MNKSTLKRTLKGKESNEKRRKNIVKDLKSLFKAGVLLANVLPVLTGFCLALYFAEEPFGAHWITFILTISGSTFVMAGALLLNNWYDADIDAVMERTKGRPTVTGSISLRVVFTLGIILSAVGVLLLLFTTIEATVYAVIGWITYVIFYTMWSKRRYTFNTIIGSVSGAVTPLIGWAVIDSAMHPVPFVLFMILFIFQMPHTYVIAIRKFEEYKAAGVKMLPVVRGLRVTKWHTFIYIFLLIPLPFFIGELGIWFMMITTIVNVGWLLLSIRGFFVSDDLRWANQMFRYSVYYLMITFLTAILVTF